jgi:hypothetical protein
MKYSHSVMYAESMMKNEMWVSLVEKARHGHAWPMAGMAWCMKLLVFNGADICR